MQIIANCLWKTSVGSSKSGKAEDKGQWIGVIKYCTEDGVYPEQSFIAQWFYGS